MTAPTISWSDLADRSVGVWGLGVEGHANLRKLRSIGIDAVLVDDRPDPATDLGRNVLATASGGFDALLRCDVVVKSPGISRRREEVTRLEAEGVAVAGGLGLWMEEANRERVVCITGTKGKSTTATVLGHLLTSLGHQCLVGGNIGSLPFDPDVVQDPDFWVLEISSFQALDLASAPPTVAVTSLHPDHLDWHGDVATYYEDKLSCCTLPGVRHVIAGDTPELRRHREYLGPDIRWVSLGDPELEGDLTSGGKHWYDALGLVGDHLRRDALIARACLDGLSVGTTGIDLVGSGELARAAQGFVGLDHRVKTVGTVEGVDFVDDGLSTNVLSAIAALQSFAVRRVALLVGGFDRGIDYGELVDALVARGETCAVFTLPESGTRIGAQIRSVGRSFPIVTDCTELGEAVSKAFDWARPDGVVLLSPAAPSFGAYANYLERSVAFAAAMAASGGGVT